MLFLTIGLLGAFTTFSTLSFESWALIEVGSYAKALLNMAGSILLGLVAVLLGLTLGRAFGPSKGRSLHGGVQGNRKTTAGLREIGMAGATVLKRVEGFGANSRVLKTARLLRLSEDLPVLVEVVDSEEKIEQAVAVIEDMLEEVGCGSMMTLEKVEIIRYKPGE
jgi:PII-like signaling protein